MRRAHPVEAIRAAEAALMARLPDGALMQRAARGLAHAVLEMLDAGHGGVVGQRVLLLVGAGDNGGDALFAGAYLARRGVAVEAWLLSERVREDGVDALRAAGGTVVPAASADLVPEPAVDDPRGLRRPHLVVDGIVGLGGRPGLKDVARTALAAVEGVPVVAVDVPSGVGVDTGELDGPHVRATATITFGTHRVAHLVDPAAAACGAVHLVDLGLDLPALGEDGVAALQAADVAALLPRPAADAQKYSRGVVGVRAGSSTYPGAGLLSVAGAACGLAGMVRYVGDDAVGDRVRQAHPEVVGAGRVQAWVVGSGSGDGAEGTLREALDDDVPLVVDADALAVVAAEPALVRGRPAVLTPHAGEAARLLDVERSAVEARPLESARALADGYGVTVLLKGPRTLVATPGEPTFATATGTPWLATAGAGDVLGGLIGALLASGLRPQDAAAVGAWLHGAAATTASAGGPLVALDVARALPGVVRSLLREH